MLDQHLEWAILLRLARFEDTLLHSVVVTTTNGKVSITAHCHHVAGYLVRLSALVSKYYSQTKVLLASATREPQSAARASARMQLLSAVIEVRWLLKQAVAETRRSHSRTMATGVARRFVLPRCRAPSARLAHVKTVRIGHLSSKRRCEPTRAGVW